MTTTAPSLQGGTVTMVGGLPHRDARDAALCSLRLLELPAIPSLPRRSPAEGAVSQAMVGIQGVTVGQYGSIAVDPARIDPEAPLVTDLDHDAFAGFRAFFELAPVERPDLSMVKWQCIGPVSLGLALERAGVPAEVAFDTAVHVVRERVCDLFGAVSRALPGASQVVIVEEPALADVMHPGFPIAPDVAVDAVSGALAAAEAAAIAGLHVCGVADIATQLATGPTILSVPVDSRILDAASLLVRFMDRGGFIAWGVVSTTGPVPTTSQRAWRDLNALWSGLVERGADPSVLRRQSLLTPECGLSAHSPAVAERVVRLVADIGRRVREHSSVGHHLFGA